MFITRLISTLVLIPTVISISLLLSSIKLAIFLYIICLISAWEWSRIMCFSMNIHRLWMCIISVLLYIIMEWMVLHNYSVLCANFWYIFKCIAFVVIIWWLLAFFLILSYPHSVVLWKDSNVLRFCFGMLIIAPFFWGVLTLTQFFYFSIEMYGRWWLLYVLILIWMNDSSAYIFGKKLGRYRMLVNVSPNKTWEGFIGGIVVSIGTSCIFIYFFSMFITKPLVMFILSVITIFSATIGDLIESMFKRSSGIKNSSNLIPGHGGILDRIDSLTSSIPIFVCLMLLFYYKEIS